MFVKYPMQDPKDYRGNVNLVVKNGTTAEIAYAAVEIPDPDMIELSAEEVELVKSKARGGWKAEITGGIWATTRDDFRYRIDILADEIRKSYLEVGFATIDLEYLQVEMELDKWEKKGKPTNDVPTDIDVWREVTGQDLEWTVTDIRTAINNYRYAISEIRKIRLRAKADLKTVDASLVESTYYQTVDALEALRLQPAPTE